MNAPRKSDAHTAGFNHPKMQHRALGAACKAAGLDGHAAAALRSIWSWTDRKSDAYTFVSQAKIIEDTLFSESTIRRALSRLEEANLIGRTVRKNAGFRHSHEYVINWDRAGQLAPSDGHEQPVADENPSDSIEPVPQTASAESERGHAHSVDSSNRSHRPLLNLEPVPQTGSVAPSNRSHRPVEPVPQTGLNRSHRPLKYLSEDRSEGLPFPPAALAASVVTPLPIPQTKAGIKDGGLKLSPKRAPERKAAKTATATERKRAFTLEALAEAFTAGAQERAALGAIDKSLLTRLWRVVDAIDGAKRNLGHVRLAGEYMRMHPFERPAGTIGWDTIAQAGWLLCRIDAAIKWDAGGRQAGARHVSQQTQQQPHYRASGFGEIDARIAQKRRNGVRS
jgi:hypothetical protein